MERLEGSMELLSNMQLTADMEGLDAESKALMHSREVLAIILQGAVEEYRDYSREEIMDFIFQKRRVDAGGGAYVRIRAEHSGRRP